MKSEVKKVEKPEYPCLMVSPNGAVLLLTSYRTGTCIYSGDGLDPLGGYAKNWEEDYFMPFTGTVTLSN